MAENNNEKNSVNKIKTFIKTNLPSSVKLEFGEGENAFSINVKKVISFTTKVAMVRELADLVFMENENGEREYVPEVLSLAEKYMILKYFTDIEMSEDINDIWYLVNYTKLYDSVEKAIGMDNVCDLLVEAEAIIEIYKSKMNNPLGNIDSLFDEAVNTLIDNDKDLNINKLFNKTEE